MNIFAVDENPELAAKSLCDQHIVKMPIETCQMLSTFLHRWNISAPYKPCYQNHPCNIWLLHTKENFIWLLKHGDALCHNYKVRFRREHKCESVLKIITVQFFDAYRKEIIKYQFKGLTPFAQAMPPKYKSANAIQSYRKYYIHEKLPFARYRHSPKPEWVNEALCS